MSSFFSSSAFKAAEAFFNFCSIESLDFLKANFLLFLIYFWFFSSIFSISKSSDYLRDFLPLLFSTTFLMLEPLNSFFRLLISWSASSKSMEPVSVSFSNFLISFNEFYLLWDFLFFYISDCWLCSSKIISKSVFYMSS